MSSTAKVRSRVRTQWLALGASLVVLAGVLVAWAVGSAADRIAVVQVARPLAAGELIDSADLGVAEVAVDAGVQGLVPAASLGALAGRVATIDLAPGVLLQAGMWQDAPELLAGEQSVGAVLAPGHYPAGIDRGATALAAPVVGALDAVLPEGDAATETIVAGPVAVRILDAQITDDGDLSITLAVPAADAVRLAQLAATDRLVLVGQPVPATRVRAGGEGS